MISEISRADSSIRAMASTAFATTRPPRSAISPEPLVSSLACNAFSAFFFTVADLAGLGNLADLVGPVRIRDLDDAVVGEFAQNPGHLRRALVMERRPNTADPTSTSTTGCGQPDVAGLRDLRGNQSALCLRGSVRGVRCLWDKGIELRERWGMKIYSEFTYS
jgi:hypothetical protein